MGRAVWMGAAALLAAAVLWGVPVPGVGVTARDPGPTAGPAAQLPSVRPGPHDVVVVFGAHPDDETLGAGGFIHAAVSAGARVTIVTFTNGDGYLRGVDVAYHTLLSTPAEFIGYGTRRQTEALSAAERLGVASARVVFLGYPDRGLEALWGARWTCDRPYTSSYTRRDHSPYPRSLRPGVAYCGANVLTDVETVLRRERPTVVVLHHPADTHPDHAAAEAFVTMALERLALGGEDWARHAQTLRYLVHRGAWPTPRAYAADLSLVPPAELRGGHADWIAVPLDRSSEDAAYAAVLAYATQVTLDRSYLLSFVRRNALFDRSGAAIATAVGGPVLAVGQPGPWDQLPPLIWALPGVSPLHATQGTATLSAVAVANSPSQLFLAVRLRRAPLRETEYRVESRLFYPGGRTARLVLYFRAPGQLEATRSAPEDLPLPRGAAAESVGARINLALPLGALGHPVSVFVEVATVSPLRMLVERTPWTLVRLAGLGGS